MTVPDLAAVETYHAAVIAEINRAHPDFDGWERVFPPRDRALADRALDGLRRHVGVLYGDGSRSCRACYTNAWPCPDALDRWADLTSIGTTYGVTP